MAKKLKTPALRRPRIIKISDRYVTYGTNPYNKTRVVYPQIRLSGKWLADCGFYPGQYIEITPGEQRLVIQLVTAAGTDQHAPAAVLDAAVEKLPRTRLEPCLCLNMH